MSGEGRPHGLDIPIPLRAPGEIVPGLASVGLANEGAVWCGDVSGKFGSGEYKCFAYKAYCFLGGNRASEDEQFARGRQRLGGQILVDLGPGSNLFGYHLACAVGATGYVAVEPYEPDLLADHFQAGQRMPQDEYSAGVFQQVPLTGEQVPAAVVQEHAVAFLRRLPPGSVSLLLSGLDACVLPNDTYIAELEAEMRRVVHPQGICLVLKCVHFQPPGLVEETVSLGDGLYYYYRAG